ncbi:DHH family phosphoesterase [Salinilacihabitans rarus]|uniref:DHH family phosphoesterase n=1 Tax=Salinilacihabitans rarus TaxID=2961596 RepID=UPI0020C91939|nr:DHH family phosphoesterase [Salinilacihabitans rarus]
MVFRLVLGCGTVGRRVIDRSPEHDGRLLVVTEDPDLAETLREGNVPAECADPTDPSVLAAIETPDIVFVASDRPATNRAALERAREAFPAATFVADVGADPTDDDRDAITALADRVVDREATVAEAVLDRTTTPDAEKAAALRRHLSRLDGPLAVVAHDNPDPDAIASAVALRNIAAAVGVEAEACYYGEISHQENRAMVNLLDLELRNLAPEDSLAEFASFALVDHSRPGVNDGLPEDLEADVVIDHHPPRGPVPGAFVDLREDVGATSTMLVDYLDRFGLDVDRRTATALLYGIQIDTDDFTREVAASDFEAAATLRPLVDERLLERIEQPTVEGETFDTIARAIKNRTQRGSVVAASAGRIASRDAIPQAADQLLSMTGIDTTLVFGFRDEEVYVSARSRANDVDLGETLRDAFGQIGSAGGHADMAGAQLEIGILAGTDDEDEVESIVSIVEEVIVDRFFEAIRTRPGTPAGAYSQTSEWLFAPDEEAEGDREDVESA